VTPAPAPTGSADNEPGAANAGETRNSRGRLRRLLIATAGYAVIAGITVALLLSIEAGVRLYAYVLGNPADARYGLSTAREWPDPGISSPRFHALVSDRYADFGNYYAYAGFPDPERIPWTDEPVHINRFGLRGPDFEIARKPGTFRLVNMGESSTFGFMVDDGQTYPMRLQEILDRRLGDGQVEVINAGLPYYTTEDMSILLRQLVAEMSPDLVTFYIGYNDSTWLTRFLLEQRMRRNAGWFRAAAIDARISLVQHSLVAGKAARWMDARLRPFVITDQAFSPLAGKEARELLATVVDEFSHRILALHRQACSLGIDHAFVTQLHAPLNMWDGTMQPGDDPFDFLVPEARERDYYGYAATLSDKLDGAGFDLPVEVFWFAHHRANEWLLDQEALRSLDFVRRVDGDWSQLATLIHLNAQGNEELARFLADSLQDAIATHDTAMIRARCSGS